MNKKTSIPDWKPLTNATGEKLEIDEFSAQVWLVAGGRVRYDVVKGNTFIEVGEAASIKGGKEMAISAINFVKNSLGQPLVQIKTK